MAHLDERLPISIYLRESNRTIDGKIWLGIFILSLLFITDIYFGLNIVPLREHNNPGKAITILLFWPVVSFFLLIRFRQFPLGNHAVFEWIRGITNFILFLIINF